MKPPPFLLGAALLFWGWQTDFLIPGVLMGALIESAVWWKTRWEFSVQDFNRIWVFCALLLLAAALYAFTANQVPSDVVSFFSKPNFLAQRNAGAATARSAASL